jgi:hypothetical protein
MKHTLAFVIALVLSVGCATAGTSMADILDDALSAIAMTRDDLHFRTDYADHPDSFRIAVVDSLLKNPMHTEDYVLGLADGLSGMSSLEELVVACASELDLDAALREWEEPGAADGRPDDGEASDRTKAFEPVEPKSVGPQALDVLIPAAARAAAQMELAFASLSDDERDFVGKHAPLLLEEDEFDPDKPIDEKEREEEIEEKLGDELLELAGRVDYTRIARAGAIVARAVDRAIPLIEDWENTGLPRRTDRARVGFVMDGPATGDVWSVIESQIGTIVVGGPGPTTYREPCAIIVDIGGDDVYSAGAAGATDDLPVSIVIDLDGDDTYTGGVYTLGAGFMGVGVLADLAGNDSYEAGDFSIASGLFGVGVLYEAGGNDSYTGDTCAQGSGAFGIGIHIDEAGNDSYHAALFSQAFGFVMGVGVLDDAAGNDLYFAGGKYTDEIRYFDHFLSLSQGFGFGWRPDASGGIGLLIDEAGNDVYVSDIFGQGSSYWFAVGGLVDYDGNDQYVSYQYAQGAATHITVAALVEIAGDDNYVSKGVSQGCGHDLAVGILHDLAGDDNYTCHDLSQAAGNANGIGVLFDDDGNDSYSVRDPVNTHGYGNLRRDYGSLGIFIDGGGRDSYSGRGADDTWWIGSQHGIGVDTDSPEGAEQP